MVDRDGGPTSPEVAFVEAKRAQAIRNFKSWVKTLATEPDSSSSDARLSARYDLGDDETYFITQLLEDPLDGEFAHVITAKSVNGQDNSWVLEMILCTNTDVTVVVVETILGHDIGPALSPEEEWAIITSFGVRYSIERFVDEVEGAL